MLVQKSETYICARLDLSESPVSWPASRDLSLPYLSHSLLPPDELRPAGIFQIFLAFQSDYQLTCKKVLGNQLSHEPGGLCVVATSDCQVASVWLKDSRARRGGWVVSGDWHHGGGGGSL